MSRVPIYSVKGPSEEITRGLKLSVYLREVGRQAAIYNASFSDAMRTGLRWDREATFRHVQSALFAAIVVNRLLTNRANPTACARAAQLRDALLIADNAVTPILSMARVRNHLEHVDERLDAVLASEHTLSVADWYITDGFMLVSSDLAKSALRAFCPRLGMLFFDEQELPMMQLDIDMLKLRNNVREALQDLRNGVSARLTVGNLKPVALVDGDDVARWRAERDRLLKELSGD